MRATIFLVCAALTGCTTAIDLLQKPQDTPLTHAVEFVGLNERTDRAELRAVLGVDPVRVEWCAAFVNAVLELDATPSLNHMPNTNPLLARSFLTWGESVAPEDIRRGDVVIFPRGSQGWQGHVGFYAGTDQNGQWVILGGNQDSTVSYAIYNPRLAIGVRRWTQSAPVVD